MTNQEISNLIEHEFFDQAFRELMSRINVEHRTSELILLSRQLSAKIRQKSMELACNKATDCSPEAYELDELLRKVIQINGEGIYA